MIEVDVAPSLIASKLHPPRLTAQHVPRRRLVDLLTRHGDRPFTLVCAPAGFGKTTLLSEWLASSPHPSAWVSLDERDNDLGVFLGYFLAAVHTIFPPASLKTRDLLLALIPPPLEALATSLSNDLDQLDRDFLLVLDDYHVITNPEIHELLGRLLLHPPGPMHLVVATRVEPPWPLAALRARGQLSELLSAHLRFTPDEVAAFVRNERGDSVSDAQIARLHEDSEGWVVGLQLLTLVPDYDESTQPESRQGEANDAIATYLFEEVLVRQPSQVRDRLLRLSILERFSASLCDALCDDTVEGAENGFLGRTFITYLESATLFVVPLDPRHEFYRFHHLFKAFLEARACDHFAPAQIAGLHRRASQWFAANGTLEEAVEHALAAGDAVVAADLVAERRQELYNQEQFARLKRLLRLLPVAVKEHHPELLLAQTRIATTAWRYAEAAVLLSQADRALDQTPLAPDRQLMALAELAVHRANLALWVGDVEGLEAGSRFALGALPPSCSHLRGLAQIGIAASLYLRGDAPGAVAYLEDQLARTPFDVIAHAALLQALGFMHFLTGDLASLSLEATRLLRLCEELQLPDEEGVAHYFLGAVHYARNDLGTAEQHLAAAVAARFNMRLLWWCQAAGLLALIYQVTGRAEEARRTLEDATAYLLERNAMRLLPNIGAFQAELDRRQGRTAEAVAWAKQVDLIPLVWPLASLEPHLERALILLSVEGEEGRDEVAGILAELRAFCGRIPNRRLLLELEALEALLLEGQGQHDAALQAVERVVRAAEPEGWQRLFIDLGEGMALLLTELTRREVPLHAAARILGAFPTRYAGTGPLDQSQLVEPLSGRELEVLALLGKRDSNKEIATRLFIAPGTVKRHTLNIYRKLGVPDRRQAVARAIELGLLTP